MGIWERDKEFQVNKFKTKGKEINFQMFFRVLTQSIFKLFNKNIFKTNSFYIFTKKKL